MEQTEGKGVKVGASPKKGPTRRRLSANREEGGWATVAGGGDSELALKGREGPFVRQSPERSLFPLGLGS